MNGGFQKLVFDWAVKTFGPGAADPRERAARLVEEAIEAAQAVGVPIEVVTRVANRVYSRPPGELGSEIGATAITLAAFAESVGRLVASDAFAQWNRVLDTPAEHWAAKHRAKIEAGTADQPNELLALVQRLAALADCPMQIEPWHQKTLAWTLHIDTLRREARRLGVPK